MMFTDRDFEDATSIFGRSRSLMSYKKLYRNYCVKCVQIRSFSWSVFSRILNLVRMRKKTDQKKLRIWTLFTQ